LKVIPIALAAHYATGGTTLARIWTCTRRDGQVFGFTDHDRSITVGGVGYEPRSGFTASALKSASDFSIDNLELDGLLESDAITSEDIEAGLWDGATIRFAELNWSDVSMGMNVLRDGSIGEIQREGLTYKAELRGKLHKLQNNVGRVVTPSCDAQLGDSRCTVDIEALRAAGAVTAVTDGRHFTASGFAAYDGYFAFGVLTWVTGANAGMSMEVRAYTDPGHFELQIEMPHPVLPDDTFTVVPGCDRSKAVCIAKFNNILNFRGFSFVPGTDKTLLVGGQ
jgi:uncharacterized phage protein (TIGR02218 family)